MPAGTARDMPALGSAALIEVRVAPMPGLSFRRPGDAVFRPAVAVQVHGGRPHQYGQRLIGPGDGDLQAATRCGAANVIRTGTLGVDGMLLHARNDASRRRLSLSSTITIPRRGAAVDIRAGALGVDGMELHADDKLGRQAIVEQQLAHRRRIPGVDNPFITIGLSEVDALVKTIIASAQQRRGEDDKPKAKKGKAKAKAEAA